MKDPEKKPTPNLKEGYSDGFCSPEFSEGCVFEEDEEEK